LSQFWPKVSLRKPDQLLAGVTTQQKARFANLANRAINPEFGQAFGLGRL